MKTVVEGFLTGHLPWPLVLAGAGITVPVILCGISGLSFAIGVYLPLASMAAIFLGGCTRAAIDRFRPSGESAGQDLGILAASGLVAGEGLAGVAIAALKAFHLVPAATAPWLQGRAGDLAALAVLAAVAAFLHAAATRGHRQ
jgi:uncharacterized oligopeptide transporter (OPT) family protein